MKTRSPAVMMASVPINSAGLVTDADFRANGWDVYRLRDRSDGDRVYAEINARNPERAIWRAEQFKDTDGHFEDMFDMEAMFDVDDEDGTDVEEEEPVEEEAVVEKAVNENAANENAANEKAVDDNAADEKASQSVAPTVPVTVLSTGRTDGETHESRWSMMGRGRIIVRKEEKYRFGDVAQHLGRLRGMFK